MPLSDSTDRKATESNIRELAHAGYPPKQRVEIALSHRRQLMKKKRKG